MEYTTPEKVRPKAEAKYSFGNDGKDDHYYVSYSCPTCNKKIGENEIACDRCGTFFDWSKKAYLIVHYDVEWR